MGETANNGGERKGFWIGLPKVVKEYQVKKSSRIVSLECPHYVCSEQERILVEKVKGHSAANLQVGLAARRRRSSQFGRRSRNKRIEFPRGEFGAESSIYSSIVDRSHLSLTAVYRCRRQLYYDGVLSSFLLSFEGMYVELLTPPIILTTT